MPNYTTEIRGAFDRFARRSIATPKTKLVRTDPGELLLITEQFVGLGLRGKKERQIARRYFDVSQPDLGRPPIFIEEARAVFRAGMYHGNAKFHPDHLMRFKRLIGVAYDDRILEKTTFDPFKFEIQHSPGPTDVTLVYDSDGFRFINGLGLHKEDGWAVNAKELEGEEGATEIVRSPEDNLKLFLDDDTVTVEHYRTLPRIKLLEVLALPYMVDMETVISQLFNSHTIVDPIQASPDLDTTWRNQLIFNVIGISWGPKASAA